MSFALDGMVRTGGDRGLFEYAAAPMDVNETARLRARTPSPGQLAMQPEVIAFQAASGAMTPFLKMKQP